MTQATIQKPMIRLKKKPVNVKPSINHSDSRLEAQKRARARLKQAGLEMIEKQMAESNVKTSRPGEKANAQVQVKAVKQVATPEPTPAPMFPDVFAPRFKGRNFKWPFCSEDDIQEMLKQKSIISRTVTA